jgi:hypothetical protein
LVACLLLACAGRVAPVVDAGAPVTVALTAAPADDLPRRTAFAGSSTCRDCHADQYDVWQHDWHPRALSEPVAPFVVGRFDHAHFKGQSSEATMSKQGSTYVMRTADRDGVVTDYAVKWLVGGKRMQDALTELDDGRWQVLPVYFHVTGGGAWVDYNEAKQGAVGPTHPFFWQNFRRTANRECLGCHATGVSVSYERDTHRWVTSLVEGGVGCEACHGPGARHAESKSKADIVAFGSLTPAAQNAICASCHGPREPVYPFLDASHRYLPGAAYSDSFQPSGLVDGESRSGEYFVDGRPSSSSFEWQALQQSRCFLKGGVTCLSCHTAPHAPNQGPDELKMTPTCTTCHADVKEHSHHATAEGQHCTGCHMPRVLTGVLDHFADHAIDVPVPENTLAHGVPNACSVCHPKMPVASLVAKTEQWWPGSQRRHRRMQLADAFDEKTKARSAAALEAVVTDSSEAPILRAFAAELLGQRFAPEAARVLPGLLSVEDPLLRSRVVSGLSAARAKGSADHVAATLTDPSIVVREFSALLLTAWGDARGPVALEKLASDPETKNLVRPHLALAQRAASAKQFETARREVATALSLMPYAPGALLLEADLAVQRRDLEAAKKALDECLRFDPANAGATRRLEVLAGAAR